MQRWCLAMRSTMCHTPGPQVGEVAAAYEQMAFSEAAAAIQKLSARGNLFMEEQAPWTAFKKASYPCLVRDCLHHELHWHVIAFRHIEVDMQDVLQLLHYLDGAVAAATLFVL